MPAKDLSPFLSFLYLNKNSNFGLVTRPANNNYLIKFIDKFRAAI